MKANLRHWDRGLSGVVWGLDLRGHLLSTWNTLDEAADEHIKWLSKKLKEFHSSLLEPYDQVPLPARFRNLGLEHAEATQA